MACRAPSSGSRDTEQQGGPNSVLPGLLVREMLCYFFFKFVPNRQQFLHICAVRFRNARGWLWGQRVQRGGRFGAHFLSPYSPSWLCLELTLSFPSSALVSQQQNEGHCVQAAAGAWKRNIWGSMLALVSRVSQLPWRENGHQC